MHYIDVTNRLVLSAKTLSNPKLNDMIWVDVAGVLRELEVGSLS